jgi:hypothetical protein
MLLIGDLDILSFIGVGRLNWIGHRNRMDSKIKISQVFDSIPEGSLLTGQRIKTDGGWNCVQTDINK